MRAASTRYGKRKVYVAGILLLAGVFLYHGVRSLDGGTSAPAAGGGERQAVAATADTAAVSCDWEEGGAELYVIRHNTDHPEGKCGSTVLSGRLQITESLTDSRLDYLLIARVETGRKRDTEHPGTAAQPTASTHGTRCHKISLSLRRSSLQSCLGSAVFSHPL